MDKQPRAPVSRNSLMNINLVVADLISPDQKWRKERLHDLFIPADVHRILRIPVGYVEDRYVWAYNDNGSYSVKSGYWFVANNPVIPLPPNKQIGQARVVLKQRIWILETLPKIRMFLWRVVSGALVVADRLQSRGLNVHQVCKLCNSNRETICHVLFCCPIAKSLLDIAHIPAPSTSFSDSLEENLGYVLDIMGQQRVREESGNAIPWLLWSIWKNRNAILYSGVQEAFETIVARSLEEATHWRLLNKGTNNMVVNSMAKCSRKERWQRPMFFFLGTVKCNINSHWRNDREHCGAAWIARDHSGAVLFHARDAFTEIPNRITGELRCLLWAMRSLLDLRFSDVMFAMDGQAALQALSKPNEWPRYRVLLNHIEKLRLEFANCSFEYEVPGSNMIAREITASVTKDGRFHSYLARGGPSWRHDRIARE